MTELEQKAAEAWRLVFDHAMPPRIAMDFVQDVCGRRTEALEAILFQAVCTLGNTRPSAEQMTGAGYADSAAGIFSGHLLSRHFDAAGSVLYELRVRLSHERVGPFAPDRDRWIDWCADAERVLKLCRELTSAAVGKVYQGVRTKSDWDWAGALGGVVSVTVDGKPLSPKLSQLIRNHSPDGFNWGYAGSGPAQLALAILLDVTGDADLAAGHFQAFKRQFVGGWGERWEVTEAQVREWLAAEPTRNGD
jgi:hypothetical protein